ncbi:MAG: heparinase II/III-family protein [Opitutaceae bacterium]|jgi:hypothetical protein|nr:heparinase II/III-family protein [Opitutaceae bacterium]
MKKHMTPRFCFSFALLASLLVFSAFSAAPARADGGADPLATLRKEHPRLIFTAQDWAAFDTRVRERASDPQFDTLLAQLEGNARALLSKPPLERKLTGRRLLGVSREVFRRVVTLAVIHRATGDGAFLRRAENEMLAAAAFADWNPSHFLDVAEMTAALALGYDWLYEELSAETRATIRQAIVKKALSEGVNPKLKWHRVENNWNQVCLGGLSLGALAIAEDEPKLARKMLDATRAGIVHGLKPYAPDGVYPEGPGYWNYGTSYQVLLIAALESALGTDWNLCASPGFLASASAQLHLCGPAGEMYNFSDCGRQGPFSPVMYWFAKKLGNPALATPIVQARNKETNRFLPLIALWWPEKGMAVSASTAPALPLAWKGEGINPVAVFRSSWTDPNALYLASKAGAANTSHGHMDAGSFILEADGVRWAIDLGMQSYETLESKGIKLWGRAQDSQRWSVFRLNNFSHNTLTIDGRLHRVNGRAEFTRFVHAGGAFANGTGDAPNVATIDLTRVLDAQGARVVREFSFAGDDRCVYITDMVGGAKPGAEVRWAMVTKAAVEISKNGAAATLRQNGKTLLATLPLVGKTHPGNKVPIQYSFDVIPAEARPKNDYDAPNPNTRILIVRAKTPDDGKLIIAVKLQAKAPDASERQALLGTGIP